MKKISTPIFMLFLTFILSCSSSSTGPSSDSSIRGEVVDDSGNPVEDAKILLSYYDESIGSGTSMARNKTIIKFSLPMTSHTKLWVTRHGSQDSVKVLVDEFKNAGIYSVSWNGTNSEGEFVVCGVYDYHFQTENFYDTRSLVLLTLNYSQHGGNDYEYFTKTDQNGYFQIDQNNLFFGFQFERFDETGSSLGIFEISRYIKIWAFDDDSFVFVDSVFVDPDDGVNINLTF